MNGCITILKQWPDNQKILTNNILLTYDAAVESQSMHCFQNTKAATFSFGLLSHVHRETPFLYKRADYTSAAAKGVSQTPHSWQPHGQCLSGLTLLQGEGRCCASQRSQGHKEWYSAQVADNKTKTVTPQQLFCDMITNTNARVMKNTKVQTSPIYRNCALKHLPRSEPRTCYLGVKVRNDPTQMLLLLSQN